MKKLTLIVVLLSVVCPLWADHIEFRPESRLAVLPNPDQYRSWSKSAQYLYEELSQAGFQLLARGKTLQAILAEQDMVLSGRMDMSTVAERGLIKGATHLVSVSAEASDEWQRIGNRRTGGYRYVVNVRLHVEVTDAATTDLQAYNTQGDAESLSVRYKGSGFSEGVSKDELTNSALREAARRLVSKLNITSSPQATPQYINLQLGTGAEIGEHFIILDQHGQEIGEVVVAGFLPDGRAKAQLVSGTLTGAARAEPAIRTIPAG